MTKIIVNNALQPTACTASTVGFHLQARDYDEKKPMDIRAFECFSPFQPTSYGIKMMGPEREQGSPPNQTMRAAESCGQGAPRTPNGIEFA
jgi:hypothetical protein